MTTRSVSQDATEAKLEYTTSALLTADDLAARWQVKPSHVYRLTRDKRIPTVKLGRYYRYRVDEIEAFERDGGVSE